jgi:hypothetical protein
MSWYKDRDFPELKRDVQNEPSEILAVIPNPKELDLVIKAHNDEVLELLNLAEEWRDSYNKETRRLKIEIIQLKQIIEDLESELMGFNKKDDN